MWAFILVKNRDYTQNGLSAATRIVVGEIALFRQLPENQKSERETISIVVKKAPVAYTRRDDGSSSLSKEWPSNRKEAANMMPAQRELTGIVRQSSAIAMQKLSQTKPLPTTKKIRMGFSKCFKEVTHTTFFAHLLRTNCTSYDLAGRTKSANWLRMVASLLALVLLMPLQAQNQARIDFHRDFPVPTITAIGSIDLMLGRPPKVHVHIQHGHIQYIASSDSEDKLKASGLKVGERVEIHEQGKYLEVRKPGLKKWVKLRLIEKSPLFNI